ncbi:MAG TPA: helix-turn-helix domain-containing protein [Anaerolineales bacterium]|nr:helix-turn-helix domain-containing protein [Anaerolineales bacterium]
MHDSFGSWVRRRRKSLDLTQEELAQRVGCSASLIIKIEADVRRPSRQITELLVEQLEIPSEQRELFLRVARQEKTLDSLMPLPTSRFVPVAPPNQQSSPSAVLRASLPLPLTSFVGREPELHVIGQQLQNPACHLLTLTGPGGVGKTRLALEVAHQQNTSFAHGACFISLVGTNTAELVIPAIADGLGFAFSSTGGMRVQLFNYLREKHILLVLDNLEHLLDGIQLLDELLERAPRVRILATSREQLNLRVEWTFEVQGLPTPSTAGQGIESNSAVALFLQRAQQIGPGFQPTTDDFASILRICQLVEGLPLGLELAAGWLKMMPASEIAREIERNMDFLSTKARDVPARHRSLRSVFDHSWSLLSREEQSVLMQLSVFRGGFTRDAAENVTASTLPILASLVDKSLVRRSGANAGRFDLHESIRQYAALRLQPEENYTTTRKHSDYYLTLLQAREPALRSRLQKETLHELRPEIDNFRAAWDFAVANAEIDLLRRATGPLFYFYELHQYFQEAETLYGRGVEMARTCLQELNANDDTAQRARLEGTLGGMLAHQAYFLDRIGRNREALDLYRASIAILRPLHEPYALAFALVLYGSLSWATGELKEAISNLQEGLPLSRTLEHTWVEAVALGFLGGTNHDLGNYDLAYQQFQQAMILCERMQDPYLLLLIGTLFSRNAQALGHLTEAQDILSETLQIARESGNRWAIGLGLEQLAANAQAMGDPSEARRLLEESIALHREIGDPWSLSRALNTLSQLALGQSNIAEAQSAAIKAFRAAREPGYNMNALDALAALAEVHARQGSSLSAFEMALFVLNHSASAQGAKSRAEELRAELESQLTPEQIEFARSRAQTMTLESWTRDLSG